MPKEVVRCRTDESARIEVGWNREVGDVQIASLRKPNLSGAAMAHTSGGAVTGDVPTVGTPDVTQDLGQYVDLDRAGINRLIRALRTARDQAYGRDE